MPVPRLISWPEIYRFRVRGVKIIARILAAQNLMAPFLALETENERSGGLASNTARSAYV